MPTFAMPLPALLLLALALLVLVFATTWAVQLKTRNAGIVDAVWACSLGTVALLYALLGQGAFMPRLLAGAGGVLWGWRLGLHLWQRNAGHPEDARYRALREEWGAGADMRMFWFFQVQAVAALLLSLAFLIPAFIKTAPGMTQIVLAAGIWVISWVGEAVADRQLRYFVQNPRNRGQVCRNGLWRYSRHPNYFFECLHWVAYAVLAYGAPLGWLTVLPPVAMTWLLLKVSGIPLLEAHLAQSRPDYSEYVRTTSVLLPWPPKS